MGGMLPAHLFWVWIFKEPGALRHISEVLGEGGAADGAFLETLIDILSRSLVHKASFSSPKNLTWALPIVSAWRAPARQPGRKQVARGGTRAQPPPRPSERPHPSATLLPERKAWQRPPGRLGGQQSCDLILLGHLGHGLTLHLG